MKRIILSFALVIFLAIFSSCVSNDAIGNDSTEAEATVQQTTARSETNDTSAERVYFQIFENDGQYSYKLINLDGSVAEEMGGFSQRPEIEVLGSLIISVKNEDEHYFYDLEGKRFSKSFECVFDVHENLIITRGEGSVVVTDAFNNDGFAKEFSDFTGTVSEGFPILSASFIEDGGAVEVVYNTESGEEYRDCFNISNGSRFVILYDWLEDLVILTTQEKESLCQYLCSYLGTYDPSTGITYSYGVRGVLEMNGKDYYYCTSSCTVLLEDGSTAEAPAGDFLLSLEKTEKYDCRETNGGLKVFTEKDLMG